MAAPRAWLSSLDPARVEERFGEEVVLAALAAPRLYASPPALDSASRLVATVVATPNGKRLSTPLRVAVRMGTDDVIDVSCACRHARICEHVIWLLVDVAFHPALRDAIALGEPTDALTEELTAVRAATFEQKTLDERLAAWLPPSRVDSDWELDVGAIVLAPTTSEARAALLLRHRRPGHRALVPARDVLAARLTTRHRQIVELTAPYLVDKNVLIATRGQASVLARLLRDEIGLYGGGFKTHVKFDRDAVRPRVERNGDRLVARWYSSSGAHVTDAETAFLLVGPSPYLWVPATHTFHEIEAEVNLDAALGLARVPSLPLADENADRVGRALLRRGRGLGVSLPEPEVFGLPPLEKPAFELRLTGTPLDVVGELAAVYSFGSVPVAAHPAPPRASGGHGDAEAEAHALGLVNEAGLTAHEGRLVASEEHAVVLWQRGIAALRASTLPRFEVLVAESIARTRIGPPVDLDLRVATSAGWLDVEAEFRAGALKVEIARIHRVLSMGSRWTVLSDGSLAKIESDVAELVGELAPLSSPDTPNAGASLRTRLAPHQFGRIARWIALADENDAHIAVGVDAKATALRVRLRDLARRPEPQLPARLEATLRPYQLAGVAWLQLLQELGAGGLLADDMGLGKTLMTLAFLARWKDDSGAQPSLVVTTTSVTGNWIREAERFTPDLSVLAWTGTESDRQKTSFDEHDVVVTTYGLLRREAARLSKHRFRCVILDEAQNVKNPASATWRAARQQDAEMRLALSGTPVENRLSELWSLMTFVNPGMLGTAADFDARYERPISLRPDGAVAGELREAVRPFILRRTKSEVLADLPPKTEVERVCVFGARQRRSYDALAYGVREAVRRDRHRNGARTQLAVLTAILRLRQMACDPRLVEPDARPEDSAKRAAFLDLVRELVSEDRRALVFSQFVELLTLWREDLDRAKVAYEYLDGSTTNRDAVVERFQKGSAPLFLISLKAGGAGLNLTAADTVIHCDPWWNPAAEDQATDRVHRIGQKRAVTVVRLVARGSIEDKIGLLKRKKQELAQAVIGADASAIGGLEDGDIDALLGAIEGDVDDAEPEESLDG